LFSQTKAVEGDEFSSVQNRIILLAKDSVRKELELLEDDDELIASLRNEYDQALQKIIRDFAKDQSELNKSDAQSNVQRRINGLTNQFRQELDETMLPWQLKRLHELVHRMEARPGNPDAGLLFEKVQDSLELSGKQLKQIQKNVSDAGSELAQLSKDSTKDVARVRREAMLSAFRVLDDVQRQKLLKQFGNAAGFRQLIEEAGTPTSEMGGRDESGKKQ